MNKRSLLTRVLFYLLFVFLFIWLIANLRSASLIWIHNTGFMGYDRWLPFIGHIRINFFIAAIQSAIILPGIIIFIKKDLYNIQRAAISLIPLCILNFLIEPIGIWTGGYSWGVVLTIAAVFLFPLCVYLILFLMSIKYKSLQVETHFPLIV